MNTLAILTAANTSANVNALEQMLNTLAILTAANTVAQRNDYEQKVEHVGYFDSRQHPFVGNAYDSFG